MTVSSAKEAQKRCRWRRDYSESCFASIEVLWNGKSGKISKKNQWVIFTLRWFQGCPRLASNSNLPLGLVPCRLWIFYSSCATNIVVVTGRFLIPFTKNLLGFITRNFFHVRYSRKSKLRIFNWENPNSVFPTKFKEAKFGRKRYEYLAERQKGFLVVSRN